MSKTGTTWFKSKRKLAALVVGASILAGTVGTVAPEPETESASTWSLQVTNTDIKVQANHFRLWSTWS